MLVEETANATIVPKDTHSNINDFHVANAHTHEGEPCKTAKQISATLVVEFHEGKGCSMTKGICMSIPSKRDNRADKGPPHVFLHPGGKKHVTSVGGNMYLIIVKDDFSRYVLLYFILH